MSELHLLSMLQRGLLLCLILCLPPLVAAAVSGALLDYLLSRLGVAEPAPPALARLFGGFLALLLLAPWLGHEVARQASSLWATLPTLGR
jgi:type III secretory pathway component EscS